MRDEQSGTGRGEGVAYATAGLASHRSMDGVGERARRAMAEDLIGIVAHDLRGYLTPLDGYIALLRASAAREGRVRDARHADAAATAITNIVRMTSRLLTAHRLNRGPLVPDTCPLDLVAVVHEVASAVSGPENIIRVEAPECLPCVGDPDLLREALANLLTNALRHSPPDAPIIVHVAATPEDGEKRVSATVRVSDRGPGIAPDLLPHLFEQFTAGPNSTGLGLGLYLARAIARAHGGALTVEATGVHGTIFRLALPLAIPVH